MALHLNKLLRMNEFSMTLNSLGLVICESLNTSHLSKVDKKPATLGLQSLDLVRWLFGEMARRPIDGVSEDQDPVNNSRFPDEELTAVIDAELEEFADKLIQKNKYLLLKTHKGSDIEKLDDESICDFLARAFRHHATEERAATTRMIASASHSHLGNVTAEVMQRALGIANQNAFHHYAVTEAVVTERMIASVSQANITEVMQRALGISDQHALSHYAEAAALEQFVASTSHALKLTDYSDWSGVDRFSTVSEVLRAQTATQNNLAMYSSAAIDQARGIAELAQTYELHAALDPFRTAVEPLASKLLHLQSMDTIKSSAYLDAFMQASTISDIFTKSIRVDHQLQEAMRQFTHGPILPFDTLNVYRQFLDSAGLGLPHWPHPRLLTIGEKRRRFRVRLKQNTESSHAKKAKTVAQRYELTLREILDEVMAGEYGEEWAIDRLPLCDCKDLLGKWQKRGGEVLDHADYAHYERIMSYPAHFETIFVAGFDDPTALALLIKRAGKLRATLQHFHPFEPEDLRDLRLIWRTIETGLLALTDDYDFDDRN